MAMVLNASSLEAADSDSDSEIQSSDEEIDWKPGNWCWLEDYDSPNPNNHSSGASALDSRLKSEQSKEDEEAEEEENQNGEAQREAMTMEGEVVSSARVKAESPKEEEEEEENQGGNEETMAVVKGEAGSDSSPTGPGHEVKTERTKQEEEPDTMTSAIGIATKEEDCEDSHSDSHSDSDDSGWKTGSWCWLPPLPSESPSRDDPATEIVTKCEEEEGDEYIDHLSSDSDSDSDHSDSSGWKIGSWQWLPPLPSEDPSREIQAATANRNSSEDERSAIQRRKRKRTRADRDRDARTRRSSFTESDTSIHEASKEQEVATSARASHPRSFRSRVGAKPKVDYYDEDSSDSGTGFSDFESELSDAESYDDVEDCRDDLSLSESDPESTEASRDRKRFSAKRPRTLRRGSTTQVGLSPNHAHEADDDKSNRTFSDAEIYDLVSDSDDDADDESNAKERVPRSRSIPRLEPGGSYRSEKWEAMFQLLVEYKNKHNTTSGIDNCSALGSWVSKQRAAYKTNRLAKYRVRRLNSVEFEWSVSDRWRTMYDRLCVYKERDGGSINISSISIENPQLGFWVSTQRKDYRNGKIQENRIALLNSIGFDWDAFDNQWESMFERLVEYKRRHKTTFVPQEYKADPKLGNWVHTQRHHCKRNDRIDRLNALGFVWDTRDTLDDNWESMYERLVEYKRRHKTTCVPSDYKADPKLGNWVCKQRSRCKRKDRIDRLNALGFVWDTRDTLDDQWESMYERLVEYKRRHKTTCVPLHYKADPKLGKWVNNQRSCCKRKDRIDRLNAIGFVWNAREIQYNDQWESMFERLAEYKRRHKTTCVPQEYKADPKLGKWVCKQRSRCKRKDRIDRLNALGFDWDAFDNQWESMYERLVEYKRRHKTTRVPLHYKADPKLGKWVCKQRSRCKRKDRIDRLNALGFVWDTREILDDNWESMFERLVEYKRRHKTTHVPSNYKADPKLGNWVNNQRHHCKRNDRIDRLNALGFVWDAREILDDQWESMFERLVEYKRRHKTTCVPSDYKADPKLGNWVENQRRRCKRKDRIDRLNALGFVWDAKDIQYNDQWESMFERLVEYKRRHKTTRVPLHYKADPKLGKWVNNQRSCCKRKYRIDRLNAIGFVWNAKDIQYNDQWESMFEHLVEYKRRHKTTCVPKNYKADPKLGTWVDTQRSCCKRKDRIDRLNGIGFVWKVRNV